MLMLALLGWAHAGEPVIAVRVVQPVFVLDDVDLGDDVQAGLVEPLHDAVTATWPEEVAAGAARTSDSVRDDAEPVVHIGLKITRMDRRQVAIAGAKTITTVRATLSPFAVDLGTGEVLAAQPYTFIRSVEQAWGRQVVSAESLIPPLLEDAIPRAIERLGQVFSPGRIEVTVVDVAGGRAWVDHGSGHGAFVGERFRIEGGGIGEVVSVGRDLCEVVAVTPEAGLREGLRLVRLGSGRTGEAPRVLVSAPATAPAGSADRLQIRDWAADALSQAGWVVVPSGRDLLSTQLAESAVVDIPFERLVNAQTVPDLVVIPRVWDVTTSIEQDEAGGAAVSAQASLQLEFYDFESGLLVGRAGGSAEQLEETRSALAEAYLADLRTSIVKDASLAVETPAPSGAGLQVRVDRLVPSGVAWSTAGGVLTPGALIEVERPEKTLEKSDGTVLVGPTSLVGVARISAPDGDVQDGKWLARDSQARVGDVIVPLSTDAGSLPMSVTVLGIEGVAGDLNAWSDVALAGFRSADGVHAVPDGEAAAALDSVAALVRRGGYQRAFERHPVDPYYDVALQFSVGVSEETRKGGKVVQVLAVSAGGSVTVRSTGAAVPLKAPSAREAVETYTMRMESRREGRARKGGQLVGLSDAETQGALRRLLHASAGELGHRLVVMLEGG